MRLSLVKIINKEANVIYIVSKFKANIIITLTAQKI